MDAATGSVTARGHQVKRACTGAQVFRLTNNQQAIVDSPGHVLVVAGPGSGKTSTVVAKIARICEAPTTRTVAVTFTRDGAQELEARLRGHLGKDALARVTVGTFHSLTLRHLEACDRKPRVTSPAQQRAFLMRCIDTLPAAERGMAFHLFEAAKCSLEQIPEIEALDWFQAYQNALVRNNLIDLYDLMRDTTLRMASGDLPSLPCTHLIVDEAQDCDSIQFLWARLHARKGVLTTLVGDDDQTIYEWRRAIGYPGMKAFAEEFNAAVIPLGENWRSLAKIVRAADQVISNNNPNRLPKDLVARRGEGGLIEIRMAGSLRHACKEIAELIGDCGEPIADSARRGSRYRRWTTHDVPTGSWAVLSRTNGTLHMMQAALEALGLHSFRAGKSLWDTPAAGLFLSLLTGLENASPVGIDMALMHFGIPGPTAGTVLDGRHGALHELLDRGADFSRHGGQGAKLDAFFRKTAVWRGMLRRKEYREVILRVQGFVTDTARSDEADLVASVAEAVANSLLRLSGTPSARVKTMLANSNQKDPERAVALYTMHGAKGLEFDNVVLLGMDDDKIPGDVTRRGGQPGDIANVSSERRLFYVAMTRAKQRLILSHTAGKASRFLHELPGI